MKSNSNNRTLAGIQTLLCLLVLSIAVWYPTLTSAVTVGPVKIEYTSDPGTVMEGEIYIKNEENTDKTLYPSVDQFTEENGEKVFIKDSGLIADWFETEESVSLKPGESRKIPYTISLPADAPPGGHFAVIWWGTVPPKKDITSEDVSIQTRAGILVYLNVNGNITEKATIKEFVTQTGKSVFTEKNVPFGFKLANEGNVYIKPRGSLKIKSLIGNTVADMPVNAKGLQILPNSQKTFGDLDWKNSAFAIGPYTAELTVLYGTDGYELRASKVVWLFPVKIISITIASVLVLGFLLLIFFKMYNRWLLKKFASQVNPQMNQNEKSTE